MYWFSRPPVIRIVLAAAVLVAGFWVELRPQATVLHPFASTSIPAGTAVEPGDVEYRVVPAGLLPQVQLPAITSRAIQRGEPVLPGPSSPPIPAHWWALELPSPGDLDPGVEVLLVITSYEDPPLSTLGLVVSSDEQFGEPTVLVAVAEEWATIVATAARDDRVTLMVGSPAHGNGSEP